MKLVFSIIFFFLVILLPPSAMAVNCEDKPASGLDPSQLITFWGDVSNACKQQISNSKNDQTTLKQAIGTINSKINLTQGQINQTDAQITALEKDITVLSGVLDTVKDSMTILTKIYLARVQESYRRSRVTSVDLIFSTASMGDYFTKVKYLNSVKAKDQLILNELENSRQDYDLRKQTQINKQQEIEKLQAKLESQKKLLVGQQKDKQNLLSLTQNDEKKFETIMKQANAQITAMKGFTSGATPLKDQTRCDGWGCYYSQRDSLWFYDNIGNSTEVLGRVGCLITSWAMVISHYGKTVKPSDIAGSTSPFYLDTAYMVFSGWNVNGVTVSRTSIGKDKIDEELNAGRPLIVGLNTSAGTHFIVLKGKNGDEYIMNDPYMENGFDKPFLKTYSFGQVFRFDKVSVN